MPTHPIRILLILETYLPDVGGAEFHLHYLAKQFLARGHAVEIVTGNTDLGPDHRDLCPVHRYPHAVGRRAVPYALVWLLRFVWLFRRFDIIHAHHSSFLATLAIIAGRLTRRPVVVSLIARCARQRVREHFDWSAITEYTLTEVYQPLREGMS